MSRQKLRLLSVALVLPTFLCLASCGSEETTDGGVDAGVDAGVEDAGVDAGPEDAGVDAGPTDAGEDAGVDAGPTDAGEDAGVDAGPTDAGADGGGDGGQDCASNAMYDISGTVAVHPAALAINPSATLDGTTFVLAAASKILSGATNPALQTADCSFTTTELTPNTTTPSEAPFDFTQVDVVPLTLGLIGLVDNTPGGAGTLVPTATGIASPPITENLTGLQAFAVDQTTEGVLAGLAGLQPGGLVSEGFILGTFVDDTGAPIAGVAVTGVTGSAQVIYPNADFSGVESSGTTSANGTFIVTGALLGSYSGDKTGYTFTSQQAATLSGYAFVLFLTGTASP